MNLLNFKCIKCGYEINKIKSIKDIFLIKVGKEIECEKCKEKYAVPRVLSIISKLYYYSLLSGFIPFFILLALSIYLDGMFDSLFGEGSADKIGIWIWFVSALVYLFMEFMVVIILPIQNKKD